MAVITDGPMETATLFNIQSFSIHDGPGIRDVIFFKGCSLKCRWCSNPESQMAEPEISFNKNRCLGVTECGRCINSCPYQSIQISENGLPIFDKKKCQKCGACVKSCPSQALKVLGWETNINELCDRIHENDGFFSNSDGGITLSGGEPLLQSEFSAIFLSRIGQEGIHRAIETAGNVPWENLKQVCPHLDLLIYDIKHMNTLQHRKHTGDGNELILENIKKVCFHFPGLPVWIRTPIIPEFNDTSECVESIAMYVIELSSVKKYELLPYHRFGESKYEQLDRKYRYEGAKSVDRNKMIELQKIANCVEEKRKIG